jgi:hypothetical protein
MEGEAMAHQDPGANSSDPKQPHGFVERMNVPFAVPKATGGITGTAAPEYAFRRGSVAQTCAICGKNRSDSIHAASEEAAASEHWPV